MVTDSVQDTVLRLNAILDSKDIHFAELKNVLQQLTCFMKCPETRSDLTAEQWIPITRLSTHIFHFSSNNDLTKSELEVISELLRFLRNACAGSCQNQQFILCHTDIFNFAKNTLKNFLSKQGSPTEILILKICIQLFGNILVGNESSKSMIWRLFFEENIFGILFQNADVAIQECAMMVLYNCMSDDICKNIFITQNGQEIVLHVTSTLLCHPIDWGELFVEYLLKFEEFFSCCYNNLPRPNRLLVLDLIAETLKTSDDGCIFISISTIDAIKSLFLKHITELYKAVDSNMEPAETITMLSILCSASINDSYISLLQNSSDLLATCVEALKCIHLLGKEGCNVFSSMSDFKQISSQFSEEMARHPFYGFKKNLIRLIGNLCCSCRGNQDLVRSLDGIPLILDCCKFDAKNPYITQWCILAIRNIMENNPENQAILAGMTVSNDVADANVLHELGLEVHSKDGKLHIQSVSSAVSSSS